MSDRYWRDPWSCDWILRWDRFAILLLLSSLLVLIGCLPHPTFVTPPPPTMPMPIITPAPQVSVHLSQPPAAPPIVSMPVPIVNVLPAEVKEQPVASHESPQTFADERPQPQQGPAVAESAASMAESAPASPDPVVAAAEPSPSVVDLPPLRPEPDPLFSPANVLERKPVDTAAGWKIMPEPNGADSSQSPNSTAGESVARDAAAELPGSPAEIDTTRPPDDDVSRPPGSHSGGRTLLAVIGVAATLIGLRALQNRFADEAEPEPAAAAVPSVMEDPHVEVPQNPAGEVGGASSAVSAEVAPHSESGSGGPGTA